MLVVSLASMIGFQWLVYEDPQLVRERYILSGVCGLLFLATFLSRKARKYTEELLQIWSCVIGAWTIRHAASTGFSPDVSTVLFLGLFGISVIFRQTSRLLIFHALMFVSLIAGWYLSPVEPGVPMNT
ncbi:MAG: hypothetical protein KC561_17220, partial [Myxococcales bacterium]|nr:hypothetical protein [Myxococcales bacterium]